MAEEKQSTNLLDDLTLKVHKALDQGFTKEQITAWLKGHGYTPESWHNAAMRRNEQLVRQARNPLARAVTGYTDAVLNGLTLGVHNHVRAGFRALVSDATYEEALGDIRATEQQHGEAHPITSTVGSVAGSVGSGMGAAKLALKAAPRMAPVVGEPLSNLGKAAALESGLGASEAAATALTAGASADQIGGSAVLGGTLGLLSPLVSGTVGKVVDHVGSSAKTRALGELERKIGDDFDTPDSIRARAQEFEDAGMGDEPNIAYLGGPNVQQQSKTAALIPGPTLANTRSQNLADQAANRQQTEDALVEGLGYANQGSDALRAAIVNNMRSKAEPLYEMAWKTPAFSDQRIDKLMRLPRFKAAYTQAVENAKHAEPGKQLPPYPLKKPKKVKKGQPPPPPAKWSLYGLHQTKIALDEIIGGLQSGKDTSRRNLLASNLKDRKNELLAFMDEASDEYGQARLIWSSDKKSLEAFNLGGDAYRATKTADQIKTELAGLETDAEKQLYRIGAATQAVSRMDIDTAQTKNYARTLLSPDMMEKHKLLFPDEYLGENFIQKLQKISQIHEGAAATTPRSDTAGNQISLADAAGNLLDVGPGWVRKNYYGLGRVLRQHLAKERDIATNTELGNLLRTKGVPHVGATMDAVEEIPLQRAQQLQARGLLSAGVSGALAQEIGRRRSPQSLIK